MTNDERIKEQVLKAFRITPKELRVGDKSRKYFYCRCALANLLKASGYSLHQIGDIVCRNHSTVAYYLRVHGILMEQVESYSERFSDCIIALGIDCNVHE